MGLKEAYIMKFLVSVIWFLLFAKLFFFWIWLWQLKECHLGRFLAHFETQAARKFLFSFKGFRFPKLTKKIIAISFSGIIFESLILFLFFSLSDIWFYFLLLILLLLAPIISSIIVLAIQIPTGFAVKKILMDAEKKRKNFKDLLVIGITGSYGKTSVKEFLGEILSQKFNILKTEKNINAEIGILTGIGEQHLSTFSSQENIINAKFELIESLPEDGVAIFNGDNELIILNLKFQISKIQIKNQKLCSVAEKLDIWAENMQVEKEFILFRAFSKDGDWADFKVNLLGSQNVINILLAAVCVKELGMRLQEISNACLKIRPEQGGMKFLRKKSPVVLDASYSANFNGVMADLEYLKLYQGKKVIIMPCLIELNGVAKEIHRKIGRKIAKVCDLAIITTADYFEEIKQDSPKIILIENPNEIIEKIKGFKNRADVILLEGRLPKAVVNFF